MIYNHLSKYACIQICMIGGTMTGKSSLLALFADEKFNESYIPTIGIDFRKITKYFGSQFVKVIIWYLSWGDFGMKFFHDSYRQKFDIILFVYDITNFNSLLYVKTHMEKFSDSPYWPRKPLGVLVSTKSDLIHKRYVSIEEGVELGKKVGLYFQASAKTGYGITTVLNEMVRARLYYHPSFYDNWTGEILPKHIKGVSAYPYAVPYIKISMLGAPRVGKSSLLLTLIKQYFYTRYKPTIGVDLRKKEMVVEGVLRCLTITDFGSVVLEKKEKILQETDVFVFVFDITKAESFCYAQELRETVSNMVQSADSKLYFLLGNKADLPNHEISIESMQLSAYKNHYYYRQISAKSEYDVQNCFQAIFKTYINKYK